MLLLGHSGTETADTLGRSRQLWFEIRLSTPCADREVALHVGQWEMNPAKVAQSFSH